MKLKVEIEIDIAYNQDETDITPEKIQDDITVIEDPMIDGYTITRKGRLGNRQAICLLESAELVSVTPIHTDTENG